MRRIAHRPFMTSGESPASRYGERARTAVYGWSQFAFETDHLKRHILGFTVHVSTPRGYEVDLALVPRRPRLAKVVDPPGASVFGGNAVTTKSAACGPVIASTDGCLLLMRSCLTPRQPVTTSSTATGRRTLASL